MKKLLLFIITSLSYLISFSQPVSQRSNGSSTVNDPRLMASLNFIAPRYADTTAANVQIGVDSCGALVFLYSDMSLWVRKCSPKRWVKILNTGDASGGGGGNTGFGIDSTVISGTANRILFVGPTGLLAQNSNLIWNNITSRFGLGTTSPDALLHVNGISHFGDTGILDARFSYDGNYGSSFTKHSLIDKNYSDSSTSVLDHNIYIEYTIEYTHVGNSITSYQNDTAINAQIRGAWIGTYRVGITPSLNEVYISGFDAGTGTITFTNGRIMAADRLTLVLRVPGILLRDAFGRPVLDSGGNVIFLN